MHILLEKSPCKLSCRALLLLLTLFSFGLIAACDNQGPAEEAGEAIDDSIEDAGDAIEDASN